MQSVVDCAIIPNEAIVTQNNYEGGKAPATFAIMCCTTCADRAYRHEMSVFLFVSMVSQCTNALLD